MGWHPEDRDLVTPAYQAREDLDCRPGQMLAWADRTRPDSIDGRRRVYEYGIAATALLPPIELLQRSEDSKGLRIENLLVVAQVVVPAWEDLVPAPFLGLNCFSWSAAYRCPEARGEG